MVRWSGQVDGQINNKDNKTSKTKDKKRSRNIINENLILSNEINGGKKTRNVYSVSAFIYVAEEEEIEEEKDNDAENKEKEEEEEEEEEDDATVTDDYDSHNQTQISDRKDKKMGFTERKWVEVKRKWWRKTGKSYKCVIDNQACSFSRYFYISE